MGGIAPHAMHENEEMDGLGSVHYLVSSRRRVEYKVRKKEDLYSL